MKGRPKLSGSRKVPTLLEAARSLNHPVYRQPSGGKRPPHVYSDQEVELLLAWLRLEVRSKDVAKLLGLKHVQNVYQRATLCLRHLVAKGVLPKAALTLPFD